MVVPIICVAVIAFLIVLCVIYFKEVKNWLGAKFGRFFKFKKKEKKEASKPKPEKKEKQPTYTVEDFKPIVKNAAEEETRDASIERLFAMDDLDYFGENFLKDDPIIFPKAPTPSSSPKMSETDKKALDEFFKDDITFKKVNNNLQDKNSISKQIKDLSPEMKALLLDNVLKKRDDV